MRSRLALATALGGLVLAGSLPAGESLSVPAPAVDASAAGVHKLKHLIFIMQENRSFDHYFGTFPGADGIPMADGVPAICVPDPFSNGQCVKPYHNTQDENVGGPHRKDSAAADIHDGKMDGFIREFEQHWWTPCHDADDPACTPNRRQDLMGYHDGGDIPNYWAYAKNFTLQDHMFQPDASWSLPSHLFMVSAWSAHCPKHDKPMSCVNEDARWTAPEVPPEFAKAVGWSNPQIPIYAWTDITYLMHKNHVSWGYYVMKGTEPDCEDDDALSCVQGKQDAKTPGIWNPLPLFDTVKRNGQLENIQSIEKFYAAAKNGTLPNVSWIAPSNEVSEHPTALVSVGQSFVTSLVNAVMNSPDWESSAIFISWDDWGGFYDHVVPPHVDENGYGLRVPGLMVSPYSRRGYIDHQTLSFDAYLKLLEDDFLGGSRLDPKTDGRPDRRPDVRENMAQLGDLTLEFDFDQTPRPAMVLPVHPETTLVPPKKEAK